MRINVWGCYALSHVNHRSWVSEMVCLGFQKRPQIPGPRVVNMHPAHAVGSLEGHYEQGLVIAIEGRFSQCLP
jgi:hypothetical protein